MTFTGRDSIYMTVTLAFSRNNLDGAENLINANHFYYM